jgi:eukaryotic-like serine/threonine-protein kinase
VSKTDGTHGRTVLEVTSGPVTAQNPVKRIGDFDLLKRLGQGGMAEVWLAKYRGRRGFAKTVALKIMKADINDGHKEHALSLFVDEARIAGALRHPNLVEVYDFGEAEGMYWISMEFVDGWTLDHIIKTMAAHSSQVPLRVLIDLFLQVSDGLDHAHDAVDDEGLPHNVVHRDIKPENIIVSRRGVAKLMDFGIAKASSNIHQTADANTARGTVLYMSPEQATGKHLDRRSDVFSLGSTMYTAIMGMPPFVGSSIPEIMMAIASGDRDDALSSLSERPDCFIDVFTRCTENDRDDRYETVGELRADLFSLITRCEGNASLATWVKQNLKLLTKPEEAETKATGTESMIFLPASDIFEISDSNDVNPDQPTRAQVLSPNPPKKRKRKRKRKQIQRHLVLAAILGFVILGAGLLAVSTITEPSISTTVEQVEVAEQVPQIEPIVAESLANVDAATPEATIEAATPTPRIERPAPAARATQPRVEIERSTPAPVIAAAEPGTVTLTARPYANVEIDGVPRGSTPKQNMTLQSGKHSIVFICVSCKPEAREVREVEILPGSNPNIHVRFNR